ncbi:hypothetical protein [Xenorhabdus innexi]|uniref:Bacteriocin n=1 Tax=Xenorhabdus innexi TaxID=290109 RepID=A0A1N6N0Q5_9GAMM|nr:hypothetical protein [Xenorhabdus innexi]PHM25033.1 hypothetical protein Xinn_04060 [Xenorhabdus innexi]SIP74681.1 hypothetical protein XIS1_770001 [Xenorhabdus innexi]
MKELEKKDLKRVSGGTDEPIISCDLIYPGTNICASTGSSYPKSFPPITTLLN